jgi:hypothetical protein
MALRLGTTLFFTLWAVAIAFALVWHFGPDLRQYGFATRSSAEMSGHASISLGRNRDQVLAEATRTYLRQGNPGTPEMKAGTALAPPEFLNDELDRLGEKWRVRTVDGLTVDIFEVS